MNKIIKIAAAGMMAVSLAACGSTSDTTDDTASESTAAATVEATEEALATSGSYVIENDTGSKVTELYVYLTGSDDKGDNYAADGLDDGATVNVDIEVSEDEAQDYADNGMTVEYVTEEGDDVVVFTTLSLEEANMYLKPKADVESGATPFIPAEDAAATASSDAE